jgi:hypothetical protein
MPTIDVPQKDWTRTLDEFSALHDGWLVSLDVLGPTLGAQPQIRELPLRGITAEIAARNPIIAIAASRSDGEHITHIIHSPTRLQIERTKEGADVAVPDSVDGMPRPR